MGPVKGGEGAWGVKEQRGVKGGETAVQGSPSFFSWHHMVFSTHAVIL